MMVRPGLVACTAVLITIAPRAESQGAPQLLAAARQALGGETALRGISTFSFDGTLTRASGPGSSIQSLEVDVVLPGKFMKILRRSVESGARGSFLMTTYDGFDGDTAVHATVAPDATFPVTIPAGPAPTGAAEIADARARGLSAAQHAFVNVTVPLFAASSTAYPIEFSIAGQASQLSGQSDAIEMKGPDGFTWRLEFDAATHRPVKLSWKAKPIVIASATSTTSITGVGREQGRGLPPTRPAIDAPSGDPTAGMALVDWEMSIGDYKTADGLTWPHRLTTTVGGQKWEDVRIGKFKINPKIDPKTFEPKK